MMRRLGAFMLAVGFGLSFVAACLGACFAGAPAADHACCAPSEESVRAAGGDCCSVVPGESQSAAKAVAAVAVNAHMPPVAQADTIVAAAPVCSVTLAASPPLVLRI